MSEEVAVLWITSKADPELIPFQPGELSFDNLIEKIKLVSPEQSNAIF